MQVDSPRSIFARVRIGCIMLTIWQPVQRYPERALAGGAELACDVNPVFTILGFLNRPIMLLQARSSCSNGIDPRSCHPRPIPKEDMPSLRSVLELTGGEVVPFLYNRAVKQVFSPAVLSFFLFKPEMVCSWLPVCGCVVQHNTTGGDPIASFRIQDR